jgi:hypothetical protein
MVFFGSFFVDSLRILWCVSIGSPSCPHNSRWIFSGNFSEFSQNFLRTIQAHVRVFLFRRADRFQRDIVQTPQIIPSRWVRLCAKMGQNQSKVPPKHPKNAVKVGQKVKISADLRSGRAMKTGFWSAPLFSGQMVKPINKNQSNPSKISQIHQTNESNPSKKRVKPIIKPRQTSSIESNPSENYLEFFGDFFGFDSLEDVALGTDQLVSFRENGLICPRIYGELTENLTENKKKKKDN